LRQIIYVSTLRQGVVPDTAAIVATSRRRNAEHRLTSMLFFDGQRFLQALEGEAGAVEATFARIAADPRHHALIQLANRRIDRREFGMEGMAYRAPLQADLAVMARMAILAAHSGPAGEAGFASFAAPLIRAA